MQRPTTTGTKSTKTVLTRYQLCDDRQEDGCCGNVTSDFRYGGSKRAQRQSQQPARQLTETHEEFTDHLRQAGRLANKRRNHRFDALSLCVSKFTLCPKKHYRPQLKDGLTDYNNFWYKYSRRNWASNDDSSFHLTERLFLNHLRKPISEILHFYSMQYDYLIKITHR